MHRQSIVIGEESVYLQWIKNVFYHVMAHFPVTAVVEGGPARALPVRIELPVDSAHVFNVRCGLESLLPFEPGFHAHTLLDLS